jgi:hypothetical protein
MVGFLDSILAETYIWDSFAIHLKDQAGLLSEESHAPEPEPQEGRPLQPGATAPPEQDVPRSRLITQFVVFPLAIVLVGVSIYLFMGILTSDNRSANDYLDTIRRGGINSRWQAAYELVKVLSNERRAGTLDPRFGDEIVRLFESSVHDDPRVRRYLARAMEMVEGPTVEKALIGAMGDPDDETRLYAIHSLGSLRAESSVDSLLPFVKSEDAGFRKASIYALGQMQDPRVVAVLEEGLHDSEADVKWNAALQLARRGSTSGQLVLGQMMHRPYLDSLPDVTEDQKVTAIVYAIRAAGALEIDAFKPLITTLKTDDPSMKVRQAAIEALEAWGQP